MIEGMSLGLQHVIPDYKASWVHGSVKVSLVTRTRDKGIWAGYLGSIEDSAINLMSPWSSLGLASLQFIELSLSFHYGPTTGLGIWDIKTKGCAQ